MVSKKYWLDQFFCSRTYVRTKDKVNPLMEFVLYPSPLPPPKPPAPAPDDISFCSSSRSLYIPNTYDMVGTYSQSQNAL